MELTLGRPSFHDHGSSFIHLHAAHQGQATPKLGKLKAYLKSLTDERQKIEAFKRELPICMQLLSNEIEASREQICGCKNEDTCTFLRHSPARKAEHTIPREVNVIREEPNNCESAVEDGVQPGPRLISTSSWLRDEVNTAEEQEVMVNQLYRTRPTERFEKDPQACSPVLGRRPGGAFVPFLKDGMRKPFEEAVVPVASPSHAPHQDAYPSIYVSASTESSTHQDVSPTAAAFLSTSSDAASQQEINEPFDPPAAAENINIGYNGSPTSYPTPHRKPRRCWSTDLHRKFVNALKQLGGPEVATPKQIRELMHVDGLTNDEIKSHLQKYRLHTKRPNPLKLPATDAAQAPKGTPQVVVQGGIWVPTEYPLKQAPPEYISPQARPSPFLLYQPFASYSCEPNICKTRVASF